MNRRDIKRDENILHVFSDDALNMDGAFKAKLKKKTLMSGNSGQARFGRVAWPKRVLAPVAVFGLLVVFGLVFFGGGAKQPLSGNKVSAQEVVNRSKAQYDTASEDTYNFYSLNLESAPGPKYPQCMPATSASNQISEDSYTYVTAILGYYDAQSHVAARYTSSTYGAAKRQYAPAESFYNANYVGPKSSVWLTMPDNGGLPDSNFELNDSNTGRHNFEYVNPEGNRVTGEEPLKSRDLNGRQVYTFYVRMTDGHTFGTCTDNVTELNYDITTYDLVERSTYVRSVNAANLVWKYRYDLRYDRLDEEDAIKTMTVAGFDKAHANSELPLGHD